MMIVALLMSMVKFIHGVTVKVWCLMKPIFTMRLERENRIIFFADVERALKTRLMEKFNHWFGKNVMTAANSPNETGDQTGGLNKAFGYVYQIRLKAKALKRKTEDATIS